MMPPAGTLTTGGPSVTATGKVPTATAPVVGSTAVHSTLVTPIGNVAPDAGVHAAATTAPVAVLACATNVVTAPAALVASAARLPGSASVGAAAPALPTPTGSWG